MSLGILSTYKSGLESRVTLALSAVGVHREFISAATNESIACLPSLRPLLSLVFFGSVERPSRRVQEIENEAGLRSVKSRTLWTSYFGPFQSSTRNGVGGEQEDDVNHAFVRLPENKHANFAQSGVGASNVALANLLKEGEIYIRTDLYVDSHV